ncbi:MAG: SpoIID/LytB domain-containing protein, partial [Clostridia bacterium]|nr:SpoIID/LytB domain-containing protein [Clostridia bacterium]
MRTRNLRKTAYACARVLCAALALFALLCAAAHAETDGTLRVKLARLGSPASIEMRADCDYWLAGDAAVRVPAGTDITLSASGGALSLTAGGYSVELGASAELIRDGSGHSGMAFIAPALSNRFCGDLCFSASAGAITTVLRIYVEDYLHGVVGCEMPPSSGIEALKAQAVVARNYALRQKAARVGSAYDLSDAGDALSFRGYSAASEYADAVRAVDATKGQVLYYDGSPATCYFCDSNGGQTESSANALGEPLPYSAVRDDPYDLEGSGAKKTATLRADGTDLSPALVAALLDDVSAQLAEQGVDPAAATVAAIEDIEPESPLYDAPSRLYEILAFDLTVTG